jgi:hypothetical protein
MVFKLSAVSAEDCYSDEGGRLYGFDLPPMYRVPPTKIENADAPFGGTSIELPPIGVEQPIPLAATIGEFLLGGGGSPWSPSAVRSASEKVVLLLKNGLSSNAMPAARRWTFRFAGDA